MAHSFRQLRERNTFVVNASSSMLITRRDRRDLRFTIVGGLAFTAICALLMSLWLPRIKSNLEIAENLRKAHASSRLFGNVERGESNEVAKQLSIGADPNVRSKAIWDGHEVITSALNIAVRNGDYASIQILLDAGADPNLAIPNAPLQTALQSDANPSSKQQLATLLLNAGADLRANPMLQDQMLENLPSALPILKRPGFDYGLREMCIVGDLESLKGHLAAPIQEELTHVRRYKGTSTLLGIALLRSHSEMAHWLLNSGVSTNVDDSHNANALTLAAVGNCVAMLKPLVLAGCNINAGDISGDTPLNYAIPQSDAGTIAALIDLGANVNQLNEAIGTYPIHQAAARFYRAHKENAGVPNADQIVLELVKSGANLSQLDTRGRSAIELTHEFRELFETLVVR